MRIRDIVPKGLFKETNLSMSEIFDNYVPIFRLSRFSVSRFGDELKFYDPCSQDRGKDRFRLDLSNISNQSNCSAFVATRRKKYLPFSDFERLSKFNIIGINIEVRRWCKGLGDQLGLKPSAKPVAVIDLHGLNPVNAVQRTLDAINNAILEGVEKLIIIHGRGTGRLRKEVANVLGSCDTVRKFQLDKNNPGRTVAYF